MKEHSDRSARKCFSTLITSERSLSSALPSHNRAKKSSSRSGSLAVYFLLFTSIIILLFQHNQLKVRKTMKICSKGSYYHTASRNSKAKWKYSTKTNWSQFSVISKTIISATFWSYTNQVLSPNDKIPKLLTFTYPVQWSNSTRLKQFLSTFQPTSKTPNIATTTMIKNLMNDLTFICFFTLNVIRHFFVLGSLWLWLKPLICKDWKSS